MKKQDYLLVFGRQPELGVAELRQWFNTKKLSPNIEQLTSDTVIVRSVPLLAEIFSAELAGVVKVGVVEGSVSSLTAENLTPFIKTKKIFGLSVYGARLPVQLGIALKRARQKTSSGKVRYVAPAKTKGRPTNVLTSVQVVKHRLLEKANAEFVVAKAKNGFVVAHTVSVQAFADWSARDFGRPGRDDKSGMLPPKLARTMVNLLGLSPKGVLLDPFCGSGTVLMEAVLRGWQQVVGSDISAKAIEDSKKNFLWLMQQYQQGKMVDQNVDHKFFTADVKNLVNTLKPESVTAIVTEPYLGPPLHRLPTAVQIKKIMTQLMPLYDSALRVFARVLCSGGRVVMVLPVWHLVNGEVQQLPACLPHELKEVVFSEKKQLIYARSGQYVARRLLLFEKL